MNVGIVLVSHSRKVSQAVIELARQLAPSVPMLGVGGDSESGFGANAGEVIAACDELERVCDQVVLIADLGSSNLASEAALDYRRFTGRQDIVTLGWGPFMESAIAASVAARGGGTLDEVLEAIARARETWDARLLPIVCEDPAAAVRHRALPAGASASASRAGSPAYHRSRTQNQSQHLQVQPSDDRDQDPGRQGAGASAGETEGGSFFSRTVTVIDAAGLHARPAALLATKAGSLDSEVLIDGTPAASMLELLLLEVECGDEVTVAGPVRADVDAIADAIANGLDVH